MHQTSFTTSWGILLVFCSFAFAGCSLIGFGLGAAGDQGNPGSPVLIPAELDSLTAGTRVRIIRKDLTEIRGTFEAKGQVRNILYPGRDYPRDFEKWRSEAHYDTGWIPAYGSSIRVVVRTPQGIRKYEGRFAGFDPGVVRVTSHPEGVAVGIKTEYVQEFCDSLGRSLATKETLARTIEGGVPFASSFMFKPGVILQCQSTLFGVPIEDIAAMNLLQSGNGKWIGLAIGAALDVVVVIVVANSMNTTFLRGSWRF